MKGRTVAVSILVCERAGHDEERLSDEGGMRRGC